jgi:hypothetical protein
MKKKKPPRAARAARKREPVPVPPVMLWDLLKAKAIAMDIRNALEDFHAAGNLSDAQMKELNPIIRNSVLSTLHAIRYSERGPAAFHVESSLRFVPEYWEEPALDADYLRLWEHGLDPRRDGLFPPGFSSQRTAEQYRDLMKSGDRPLPKGD